MKTTLETITPDIASQYIDTMNGNRSVRQNRVDFLAEQMRNGLWRVTHQGIAFDKDGRLIDGQHRMWAVVESGVTIEINVARGIDPADVSVIDTGLARSYSDIANFAGGDTDPAGASIAKVLVMGPGSYTKRVPYERVAAWREHYREQIDLAVSIRHKSQRVGTRITYPMAAAFARAAFHVDPQVLERMAEVIAGGIVDDVKESAAIVLRDAWISKRLGRLATEQYAKTEAAIRAFADRRAIKTLQRPDGEVWEIPALPKALRYTVKAASGREIAAKRVVRAKSTAVEAAA